MSDLPSLCAPDTHRNLDLYDAGDRLACDLEDAQEVREGPLKDPVSFDLPDARREAFPRLAIQYHTRRHIAECLLPWGEYAHGQDKTALLLNGNLCDDLIAVQHPV